mmetsp:Transcript_31617/g.81031  ORF Transcript_31617/g.81031 Transcript_31617/m.81031 type:complete len:243 (+) Transcript_31617:292-1020(+)
MRMPSCGLDATSADASATPAFKHSASATAPSCPANTSRRIFALYWASPPLRSSTVQAGMPRSRGLRMYDFTPSGVTSTTSASPMGVSSSSPWLCTTSAFFISSRMSASAIFLDTDVSYTPTRAYLASAGFSMGPRKLNAVRTLRLLRTGMTAFMAGWKRGANMNAMLVSSKHCAISSGPSSTETPSASRTSAEPQRLETERLPCLATLAPAAAAMTEEPVEMLTEPMSSPPVPTMSSTSYGV